MICIQQAFIQQNMPETMERFNNMDLSPVMHDSASSGIRKGPFVIRSSDNRANTSPAPRIKLGHGKTGKLKPIITRSEAA